MKTALAITLLASVTLAACSTSTSTLTPSTLSSTLTTIENDIVGYAESLCSFQPSVSTVESIITTLYPAAAIATVPEQAIAQTICSAVPPAPAATASAKLGAASPHVYPGTNIVIHGTYLTKKVGGRLH